MNVITDVAIFLLPLPSLLSLQLDRKNQSMLWGKALLGLLLDETAGLGGALTLSQIVALIFVFSVGSIAVIASILRLSGVLVYQKSQDKSCECKSHCPSGCRRPAR